MPPLHGLDVRSLGGSLITYSAPFNLNPDQTPNCLNHDPTRDFGSASKRRGQTKHSRTFAAPSGTKVSGLFRWVLANGTAFNMMGEGTKVWSYTASAETDRTGAAVITADNPIFFTVLNNLLVITHGGVPQKWDGAAGSISALGGSPPTDLTMAASHLGRIFGVRANSSIVQFSASDNPEDWTTADNSGSLTVDKDDGDTVQTLVSCNNILYIFKRNSCHVLLNGESFDSMDRKRIFEEGAVTPRAVVKAGHTVFFASDNGIYQVNGTQVEEISARLQQTYLDIAGKANSLGGIAMGRLATRQVWVSYNDTGVAGNANDKALVLDHRMARWTKYSNINARCFANLEDGSLILGRSNAVLSLQGDSGTSDDGSAIAFSWDTPDYYNPQWHTDKGFKTMWLLWERDGGATNVTVQVAFDGDTSSLTTLLPTDAIGTGTGYNYERYVLPNKRNKFVRFRITNTSTDLIRLHGIALDMEEMQNTR